MCLGDLIDGSCLHLFELVGCRGFSEELLDKPTDRGDRMGVALRGQLPPDEMGIAYPIIPALENIRDEGIERILLRLFGSGWCGHLQIAIDQRTADVQPPRDSS